MSTKSAVAAEASITLDVSLLGREYKVACKESERAELLEAVAFLDRRMREIREAGKGAATERVAVMAALNIAHDLLRERNATRAAAPQQIAISGIDDVDVRRRIAHMHAVVDQALAGSERLVQ